MTSGELANRSEGVAQPVDWLIFAIIVAIGGSSFAMIRGAVETAPPFVVTVGRLWIGAVFLYAVMRHAGRRLPALLTRTDAGWRINTDWTWMAAIACIGYVGPFILYPWAQQYLESGLAGVYMAFMPIWTAGLAFLFAGERLDGRKIAGFSLGFLGVAILLGPSALGGLATSDFLAQIGLLAATLGYATSAVLTRRAPPIKPRILATGTLIVAAVLTTPILFFIDLHPEDWSAASLANIVGLGLGPTGLAGVLLIILIQRVGAGFMALANYLTPVWAVVMGALLYGEALGFNVFLALAVILAGVAISQRRPRSPGIATGGALGAGAAPAVDATADPSARQA